MNTIPPNKIKRIDICLTEIKKLCEDSSNSRQNKIYVLANRALQIQHEIDTKLANPSFRSGFVQKLDERYGNNRSE